MYGLPHGFDASVFVGRTLEHVTFTTNTVHFGFDGNVAITLFSSFQHGWLGTVSEEKVPVQSSGVMSMLGQVVRLAEGRPDGTLKLQFEGGEALICRDDSGHYESYQLQLGDREIVV